MRTVLVFALLMFGSLSIGWPTVAQSASERDLRRQIKQQLEEWERQGRHEDIKLISSHKSSLKKQVKSGRIDLQEIVDNHNYNHKDGKYYGQPRPVQESPSAMTNKAVLAAPIQTRAPTVNLPASNRPVAAYTQMERKMRGFPAVLTFTTRPVYVFPNGYAVYCANWDPRELDPTPESVGRAVEGCNVAKERPNGNKQKKFSKGQTIDINFGNVRADGHDYGSSSSSTISGSTLRMTNGGEIAIGKFNAFSVSSNSTGVGGGSRKRALTGAYALDGHVITIDTTDGDTVTGFISWASNKGSSRIDHVYVNGEHFWDRKK